MLCIIDDPALTGDKFKRIKNLLSDSFHRFRLVELNERYVPGDVFASRRLFIRPENDDVSRLTLQVYLNGCHPTYVGVTRFLSYRGEGAALNDVVLRAGSVVWSSNTICCRVKYAIRTDVTFDRITKRRGK